MNKSLYKNSPTAYLKGQVVGPSSKRSAWMMKNMSYFNAFTKFSKVKQLLGRINLELSKIDYNNPFYIQRMEEFNTVALECSKARWYASVAIITKSKEDWKRALGGFDCCMKHGGKLLSILESGSNEALGIKKPAISQKDTEIDYADNAPVVPEICPVVILQGSSYEMGYQYARQLVEIFGPWIL